MAEHGDHGGSAEHAKNAEKKSDPQILRMIDIQGTAGHRLSSGVLVTLTPDYPSLHFNLYIAR
jgi:hypothetical protein